MVDINFVPLFVYRSTGKFQMTSNHSTLVYYIEIFSLIITALQTLNNNQIINYNDISFEFSPLIIKSLILNYSHNIYLRKKLCYTKFYS